MAGGTSSFQTGFGGAPGHIFKTHKPGLFLGKLDRGRSVPVY